MLVKGNNKGDPSPMSDVTYVEIIGCPGYKVGDDGSILSAWKGLGHGKGKGISSHWKKLKGWSDGKGYRRVALMVEQKRVVRKVHHLVLEAFVGPRPEGTECLHRNGVHHDNRLSNLRWGTAKENHEDMEKHGRQAFGERANRVYKNADVLELVRLSKEGKRIPELVKVTGMPKSTIQNILTGKRWGRVTGIQFRRNVEQCPPVGEQEAG